MGLDGDNIYIYIYKYIYIKRRLGPGRDGFIDPSSDHKLKLGERCSEWF